VLGIVKKNKGKKERKNEMKKEGKK